MTPASGLKQEKVHRFQVAGPWIPCQVKNSLVLNFLWVPCQNNWIHSVCLTLHTSLYAQPFFSVHERSIVSRDLRQFSLRDSFIVAMQPNSSRLLYWRWLHDFVFVCASVLDVIMKLVCGGCPLHFLGKPSLTMPFKATKYLSQRAWHIHLFEEYELTNERMLFDFAKTEWILKPLQFLLCSWLNP
jgi:hypothetical protein